MMAAPKRRGHPANLRCSAPVRVPCGPVLSLPRSLSGFSLSPLLFWPTSSAMLFGHGVRSVLRLRVSRLLRTGSTEFLRRVKHRRISNGHHSPALRCLRRRADTPLTVVAVASGQKTICNKRPFLQRWRCPLPRGASGHGSGVQSWQRLARCGQQEGKTWFDYPWARAE